MKEGCLGVEEVGLRKLAVFQQRGLTSQDGLLLVLWQVLNTVVGEKLD